MISAAHIITIEDSVTAPTQTATITAVSDDVSTYGSAVGALDSGTTTDDTMPTLTGTLSAALIGSQVLAIYDDNGDDATKLGEATITGTGTGTDWTYTPSSPLPAGNHSFTAQVESLANSLQGMASNIHVVNINPGISMTITDNAGAVTGALALGVRYILLKQTGVSSFHFAVNEVEVFSGGENVALGKTVTAGYDNSGGYLPAAVTDGSLESDDGYRSNGRTTYNWLLIDLGAYYSSIDSVKVYALSSSNPYGISNVDIFASTEDLSSKTYAALQADPNAINLGGTGSTPADKTSLTTAILNNFIDDTTPTLSGTLTIALGADEELAIYHGITKLGVATVSGVSGISGDNTWTFTTDPLVSGFYTFTAVIQAADETTIANARVISAAHIITVEDSITAPTQTVTITAVSDDVSTYGSVVGALDTAATTDDTMPTLMGTLSAALIGSQVLAIYDDNGDGTTKLGDATVTGINWTYTPSSPLPAGNHSFTAQVESLVSKLQGTASNTHMINLHSGIDMTVTDNAGAATGVFDLGIRYILLKQTGDSRNYLTVNEVEVFSAGVNIALGKTVTAGYGNESGYLPSAVTDGNLTRNGYAPIQFTTDNWLLIDLGAYYSSIDSVNVYALDSSGYQREYIRNVDIFASNADLSSNTYAALQADPNAINLGGTGARPEYKTSLTTTIDNFIDDTTPTLSGILTTALSTDEELAIYYDTTNSGTTKLGVATVSGVSGDNTWTFTPTDPLTDGLHTFTAVIQAAGATDIANAYVISAAHIIRLDTTAPTQTVTITTVSDDVSTHGSAIGALATGASTDDTMPTLTGTLSAALTPGQVLAIYDGATKLGDATITSDTGTDWTYTSSPLTVGNHSFTAQVESLTNSLQGAASNAHVVNINPSIEMTVTDNASAVTEVVTSGVRYILLKQTGDSTNLLWVNEVEVFSAGVNIAEGKTVTAGYDNQGVWLPSGATDASLERASSDGYASIQSTTDNWLLIDLGTYYSSVDSVNVYALSTSPDNINNIRNVDIFASNEDLSSLSYEALTAAPNAINLGGTGATPVYKTSLTTAVNNITDDSTPTLSGTLTTPLGADEELAIYHGSTKLAVVNVNSDNSWTFTTPMLIDGEYTFKAVIQATDNTAIADGRVLSAAYTITVEAAEPTPASTAAQGAAASQEALYSSYASSLEALEAKVEAKDPISGLSVQTYSLPSTAKDQTLDFPDEHTEINVVNIAGSGANTVKIQLDDVLQSGINLFNDTNAWDGLDGAGKHQLVVNGDADDTLVLDTIAEAGSWIKEGTTTNSDHTYLVYSLDSGNVNGISQVLVDQDMIRDGAIL